jgi:acetyl/propionyl-CoA carboxylase alpha subunit
MMRALREIEILGIQTTVPFFRFMLAQPAFLAGAFHTRYLDELLQQRGGEPFAIADKDEEEAALIGAAVHLLSPRGPAVADLTIVPGVRDFPEPLARKAGWKGRARVEALRP